MTENHIITTYDPNTYAQLSSLTVTLIGDGSQISDAITIDANNILIGTYNKMWLVNMKTGVETDVGDGVRYKKQKNPVK